MPGAGRAGRLLDQGSPYGTRCLGCRRQAIAKEYDLIAVACRHIGEQRSPSSLVGDHFSRKTCDGCCLAIHRESEVVLGVV